VACYGKTKHTSDTSHVQGVTRHLTAGAAEPRNAGKVWC